MAARGERQPTPLRISLQDLRLAQPEVVIFLQAAICTQSLSTAAGIISAGPAPPTRQGCAGWKAYSLYDWSFLPSALAACKALASCSSEFVCRKHSHWCLVLRAVPLRRVALKRCAGLLQSRTCTPLSLQQSALQQRSLAR